MPHMTQCCRGLEWRLQLAQPAITHPTQSQIVSDCMQPNHVLLYREDRYLKNNKWSYK